MIDENPTKKQNNNSRRKKASEFPWFPIILIVAGVVLLAQRIGNFSFHNWWALFILIPAFSAFGSAFGIWRRTGQLSFAVWSTFYGGLFPLLVAMMFLFDLDWGDYWPFFVILPGIGMMFSGLSFSRPDDEKAPPALLRHRPWGFFFGLSATLLGLTFLGLNLNLFDIKSIIIAENWWGVFILIPALGGLVTALSLMIGRQSAVLVLVNLAGAIIIAWVGIVALFNLDWNLINMAMPVILILVGIALIFGFGSKNDENDKKDPYT